MVQAPSKHVRSKDSIPVWQREMMKRKKNPAFRPSAQSSLPPCPSSSEPSATSSQPSAPPSLPPPAPSSEPSAPPPLLPSAPSSAYASKDEASKTNWDPDFLLNQTREFDAYFSSMENKIHRFPRSLSRLRGQYGALLEVPIGPYHSLTLGTMVKNVATDHFKSGTTYNSVNEMYKAFCSAVGDVRRFCYDVSEDEDTLKLNMFRDGCFLLQYMDMCSTTGREKMPQSLVCYFESNQVIIDRDIMLLENQLPWVVIHTLNNFKQVRVDVEEFIAKMARTLQVRKEKDNGIQHRGRIGSYMPPHLLGYLWSYKIGSDTTEANYQDKMFSLINCCYYSTSESPPSDETVITISKTVSAIELAEIGIKLTASKTTSFTDMGIKKRLFCSKIFLPPLLLDETRLCWLVNMVAFEVCVATTSRKDTEKHAVRSYLFILAMLMDREDDVHRLRSKGIVQGELTDKEVLDFFKRLVKHISGGSLYLHLMEEIEDYKLKRWLWIKVHKFIYKHYKTITVVLSIISVLVGIFRTLFSLKQH